MRIIIITNHIESTDGWSRYAYDIVVSLKERGHEVLCLVQKKANVDIDQRDILGDLLGYICNPLKSFLASFKIKRTIKEFNPDIVHYIVEPYVNVSPFLYGKFKTVLTVHSTYAYMPILVKGLRRKFLELYTKLVFSKIDLVIAVSNYTKSHLLKYIQPRRVEVVNNGLNLKTFNQSFVERNNPVKQILFVGAIKPRKGLLEAIDTLAYVKGDFVYKIVGSYKEGDGYLEILKKRIKELNLEDKVLFIGSVSQKDLEELYQKADLFLMLSTNNGADFEGYGLVYLEANHYGVPSIGPNDSGVTDAIVEGKTGYLVDYSNPEKVAEKVNKILIERSIDPKDCIEWSEKNSISDKVKQIENLYKTI